MAETFCVHSKTDWDCASCRRRVKSQIRSLYAEREEARQCEAEAVEEKHATEQQLDRLLGAVDAHSLESRPADNQKLYEVAEEIRKERCGEQPPKSPGELADSEPQTAAQSQTKPGEQAGRQTPSFSVPQDGYIAFPNRKRHVDKEEGQDDV